MRNPPTFTTAETRQILLVKTSDMPTAMHSSESVTRDQKGPASATQTIKARIILAGSF
jgi:hypothetical protein